MFTKDYEWYIRHLTTHAGIKFSQVEFVDNIALWCHWHGIEEADEERPLKIVSVDGTKMLVAKMIPDEILEERINAVRIRSQLKSVSYDRADLLNSRMKKFAYLFLKELSVNNPDLAFDDLAADEWIFGELDRLSITNAEAMKTAL